MKKFTVLGFFSVPFIATAQLPLEMSTATQVWLFVRDFPNLLTIIVIGLPVMYFLWHTFKFVKKGEDDEAHQKRKRAMINGIISIITVTLVWNLIIWIFFPVWVGPPDISPNSFQGTF